MLNQRKSNRLVNFVELADQGAIIADDAALQSADIDAACCGAGKCNRCWRQGTRQTFGRHIFMDIAIFRLGANQ